MLKTLVSAGKFLTTTLCLVVAIVLVGESAISPAAALSEEHFNMYAENDILYYDPDDGEDCENGDKYEGGDISATSANERLEEAIKKYGPLAMDLQREYGIPWELFFAQMMHESQMGTTGIATKVKKNGNYNWMGLKYGDDHRYSLKDYYDSGKSKWSQYKSISDMMYGYAVDFLRNGNYDKAFKYTEPSEYDLKKFFYSMIETYCPTSDGCNHDSYWAGAKSSIDVADRIAKEKGWKTSEELQKDEDIPAGGKYKVNGKLGTKLGIGKHSAKQTVKSKSGAGSSASGDNKDYAGRQVWTDSEMERVEKFKPLYEKAAKKVGIPWEMLAAVHKRETNLSDVNPTDNDDGIFQQVEKKYPRGNKVSDNDFVDQATVTARQLKEHMDDGTDDDAVKRAFFAYNGTASAYINQARDLGFSEKEARNGEGSPYVMNKADEKRDPNKNPNGWGQIKHDHGGIEYPANQDYGAYVYYKALTGGGTVCLSGDNNLNDVAILLSWPDRSHSPDDPKPEYKAALNEPNGVGARGEGDGCSKIGKSCDAFVTTVMRHSGADPDFKCCGASNVLNYLISRKDLYEEVPNTGKSKDMKPGDIRSRPSHVEMYVEVDGVGKIASASHCDRTADHARNYYPNSEYKIFRLKEGN